MDTKAEFILLLHTRNTSPPQRQTLSQSKGLEQIYQSNEPKKQAGVAIQISNKINFKLKSIKRDKVGHFIIVTGTIHQEEITILNIYTPNTMAPSYVKEAHLKLKSYIKPHTLIVWDFNTPLSLLDRSVRQKMNREMRDLTDAMTHKDLTDIYRLFHKT